MAITIEEIKAALAEQPELKDQVLSIVSDGRIVRTKEEDQQFLDSHVKAVVDEKVKTQLQPLVNEEYGKMMAGIDQLIESTFGAKKNAGEKTFDFAKRALDEKQSKGGDPITKERVKQLEQLLSQMEAENSKKLSDYEQKLFNSEINYQLDAELSKANIAVPAHLKTDEEKQLYINQQKQLIRQGFLSSYQPKRDEAGKIVFYKDEQPQLSTQDGKPKGAGDLISEQFKAWFVPQGTQAIGTGTGTPSGTISTGVFKSKEDVHKHLAAQGIEAGQPEYIQKFQQLTAEHKIDL